jgi:hypothetical protein
MCSNYIRLTSNLVSAVVIVFLLTQLTARCCDREWWSYQGLTEKSRCHRFGHLAFTLPGLVRDATLGCRANWQPLERN